MQTIYVNDRVVNYQVDIKLLQKGFSIKIHSIRVNDKEIKETDNIYSYEVERVYRDIRTRLSQHLDGKKALYNRFEWTLDMYCMAEEGKVKNNLLIELAKLHREFTCAEYLSGYLYNNYTDNNKLEAKIALYNSRAKDIFIMTKRLYGETKNDTK